MDNVNISSNQPLLLVPRRIGVNKFLRAGSKRQTKVRAFQITYDKAHRGTPIRDATIGDQCKVDEKRSSSKSSHVANKSRGLRGTTGQLSSESNAKQTENQSFSKTSDGHKSSQHHFTDGVYSEEHVQAFPLCQSTKGVSNQSGQFFGTPSGSQDEERNQTEITSSGDDEETMVPHDASDRENISPNSHTRATSKRRSPRKSISQTTDFLQRSQTHNSSVVRSGRKGKSGVTGKARKAVDVNREICGSDSGGLNDGGLEKAKDLSAMLATVTQGEMLSSPLVRSAKRRTNHTRTVNASIVKNIDEVKQDSSDDIGLSVDGHGAKAHSESIPTRNKMGEGSFRDVVTRSSRSKTTKGNSVLVIESDKSAAQIRDSEIEEVFDEDARMRLKRLEKQLGGMTPIGLRDQVGASGTQKTKTRQHVSKADNVLSTHGNKELTLADTVVKSVKSKNDVSLSKTKRMKNDSVTSDKELAESSSLENKVSSQKRRKAKYKEIQREADHRLSLHEPLPDGSGNRSRRGRSTGRGERSDSESQNRAIEHEVSPEQAKKLEKLQKQLGGMSPMDRTLALLSESRAKLSRTMPSLMDVTASQSSDVNDKAHTKLTGSTKQTMGGSKSSRSNELQSLKRRNDSCSKEASAKSVKVKIKLKVNKKRKMRRGKAKVLVDSDPEEDGQETQTSESETEKADSIGGVNRSSKRKISDLSDLDVVIEHLREEGQQIRNGLKKKRLRTVHDDIMSSVTDDLLKLIDVNSKMKGVNLLERKAQTQLTKKRKELLEMQQEHRKLCGRISDLNRQKQTSTADPATKEEVSHFLKSLECLYKEAGSTSSDGQ